MKKMDKVNWKIAFFTLLGLLICLGLACMIMIVRFFPDAEEDYFVPKERGAEEASFVIQTDRSRLNTYLEKYLQEQESEMSYLIELTDEVVQFRSSLPIMGQNVPIEMNFFPAVAENGDLLLEVRSVAVGLLQLPVERVLQLVDAWVERPDWVNIYPGERLVEVGITELEVGENEVFSFRMVTFDLPNDRIELEMIANEK
ncbi:YpmS family protein [Alkalihalobacillus oceani]|uniref:YpmS family protein n=1 Tax=Halalkalibacter oceani TaxID=1653776 RepID=A0A9X2DMC9_9BACI|nr:YpmS family protein [Halalkalibacter oceani]MCM3712635.1 YpmS family protein [Halalkalibacter oceani]